MEFIIDNRNIQDCFNRIAIQLFNNYDLQVNEKLYQLTEIEFYYFCEQHKDDYTYKHDDEAGKLRFHYSGIDITLRSFDRIGYGGILIRGIKGINDKERIKGPLLVVLELSRPFKNIFYSNTIKFITANPQRNYKEFEEIVKTERKNLKKVVVHDKFKNSKYRYLLK